MRALKKSLEKIHAPGEYVVHRILWNEHKYSVYKEIVRVVVNVGKSLLAAVPGWGALAKAVANGVDKALGVLGRIIGRLVSWINRYREIAIANGHLSSMRYLQAVAEGPLFLTAYVFKNLDEMDRMQSAELSQIADTCLVTAGLRCTLMGERVTQRMAPGLEQLRHGVV